MARIGVSLSQGRLALANTGGDPNPVLGAMLSRLPAKAPIVVMIHGYRFDPTQPAHDPHRLLYAPRLARSCRKLASWTSGLGFCNAPESGLAIGFGWPARAAHLPNLIAGGRTGFAEIYHRAGAAASMLAGLLTRIAHMAPGRPVDVVAHSLGARVALAALPKLSNAAARSLGRLILLGGAEFAQTARAAVRDCAQAPEIYSVVARHNDIYDALFERFAPCALTGTSRHALARGLPDCPTWLTLQLDAPELVGWAAARGIALDPSDPTICHWSFYTRPGAMTLYARILRDRPAWSVDALRRAPVLAGQEPRWARLPALPRLGEIGVTRPRLRRARGH